MTAGYTHLWEFVVQPSRQAPGYLGTQLLQDRSNCLRYLTVDRWTGIRAYREFRARFAEQYEPLDRQCEGLTIHEAPLGEYGEVAPA